MSTHPPNDNHAEPGHGEHGGEDEIDFVKVIAIGAASLAIFAVCTYWAATILHRETARIEDKTGMIAPAKLGKPEIGIVDQVPFVSDQRLEGVRQERAAFLNGYGWVDRAKGIAHVPIDEAMDAVAGGAMPAGAPR